MKWWSKLIIAVLLAAIVATCAFFAVVAINGKVSKDYKAYVSLAFSAASMSSGIAVETEDGTYLLNDEACRKINYFVTRNPVTTLRNGDESITLRLGDDTMIITKLDEAGESAVVKFTVLDKTYRMRVFANGLWERLNEYTSPEYYVAPGAGG